MKRTSEKDLQALNLQEMKGNTAKFNDPPIHRCKDCEFYPDRCIYWNKDYRKANPSNSWVKPDTEHNCPDYVLAAKNKAATK